MHRIRRFHSTALIVAALALGACGGGSDEPAADSQTNGDTPQQTDDAASADTNGDTDGDQPGGGANEGESDDGDTTILTVDDVPGISDDCQAIANFIGATGQLLSGEVDPAEARAILDDFLASVDDSIRADADVMAGATAAFLDVIEEFGGIEAAFSSPEGMQAIAATSTPEYIAATERITDYLAAECEFG